MAEPRSAGAWLASRAGRGFAAVQHRALYPFLPGPSRSAHFSVGRWIAHDGLPLEAWIRMGGPDAPVVVFFMGNTGRLKWFEPRLERMARLGVTLVAMGYRGGSDLPGRPGEAALKADALAFFDQVGDLIGCPGLVESDPGRVHLLGTSMGTGLALHVAARRRVASVILEAPFTRIADIVRRRTVGLIDVDAAWNTERWDSRADIVRVAAPVLVIHGTFDLVVPFAMGRELAGLAPHPASRLLSVPGASHGTALVRGGLAVLPQWLSVSGRPCAAEGSPATPS